ncbi:hypothetical protein L1049_027583 [Liquidambar formosana]|uniref:Uncharacterized protein n=1 Tax=Liquidambar formosana TaxID=63359 RepID=A0AAP0RL66_LIQFO
MAVPNTRADDSSTQIALIETDETQLNKALQRLETFLRIFGFCQNSPLSFILSWAAFLLVGVAVPVLVIELSYCSDCEKYEIKSFELEILIFESLVAAVSLICISHNLRKYGMRRFLFVDRHHGHMTQFRYDYIEKINGFFRLLAVWVLPCFLVKTVREVVRVIYVHNDPWWQSVAILFALLASWTYSTMIFLSASALFNLVCNLQVIHFENYGKLLERDVNVVLYIEEHFRLKHYLSKISHRFRIYLILVFLVVTASEFVALLQTTGNHDIITFINGCDFAISSVVLLVGLILCLNAAAKISHRAQSLASVASRWHALVTCTTNDTSQSGTSSNSVNLDSANPVIPLSVNYSESDLESVDYVPVPTTTQLASSMSLYQKRQAVVLGK